MIIEELNILRKHGKQYIKDISKVELPGTFRGRPVIAMEIAAEEESAIALVCPVHAITVNPLRIDIGKCLFCKECQFASKGKITFSNDYKIATNSRENLIVTKGNNQPISLNSNQVRPEVRRLFKHSLKLREVSAGGDNSCEMELNACSNVNFDMGRYGIEFVASPRHADGLVITGPITENMARALEITYAAIPEPKIIVLVGCDAISGGMFADSPALNRSFLDQHSIDLYVPGNPAHPLTFINGLLDLIGKKA
jgi:Ni,Fe-hydrogenase III small subunit